MIASEEIVKVAVKSILRNKTRSVLTMFGIVIGVAAVILLVAIGTGLQKYITGQFEELGTNLVVVLPGKVGMESGFGQGPPNFAGSKLTLDNVNQIQRMGGPIEEVAASIELPAAVQYRGKSKYTTVAGVSASYARVRNLKVSTGRQITDADVKIGRNVVILGQAIVEKLFGETAPLGKEVTIGGQKFQVVGLLDKIGAGGFGIDINNFVAIPVTSSQKVFGNKNVQAITIKSKDKESIPQAMALVKNYLSKKLKDDDFSVVDQSSLVQTINQILSVVTMALGGIAAISLVVGGVGIMNIMLVSVTERTKEIGLRKAVGAKPSDILTQFLIEAVVLSTLGGSIGVAIGSLGALALNQFISTSVTFWSVALAFGVSAAVGIVFGVAPAARASKLDPITALKYE